MIRQQFDVEHYWRVIVYYNLNYDFLYDVISELRENGFQKNYIRQMFYIMYSDAKAVTCSNLEKHISIVIFNPHSDPQDYMDSIVHEAEHIKQAMLYEYNVEDAGEPPAYTIGYLVRRMYEIFRALIL